METPDILLVHWTTGTWKNYLKVYNFVCCGFGLSPPHPPFHPPSPHPQIFDTYTYCRAQLLHARQFRFSRSSSRGPQMRIASRSRQCQGSPGGERKITLIKLTWNIHEINFSFLKLISYQPQHISIWWFDSHLSLPLLLGEPAKDAEPTWASSNHTNLANHL